MKYGYPTLAVILQHEMCTCIYIIFLLCCAHAVTPLIVDTSALTEVRLGVPVVLVCLVTGFPIPSISWRKDGEIVNIYSDASLTARLDVVEFAAVTMDTNSSTEFESSGYTGSGSIMGLLMMYTGVTVDEVRQLGELGVVGLLSFEKTVRGDTGDYTCTATNMLPETTTLRDVSNNIPLFVLGECFAYYQNGVIVPMCNKGKVYKNP